ncbi:MAG: glucose-6-phosphate isomerase, partial [Clostridia bacterium]|nr:glucose-6-phosphate isomerase [Clostridia bacterium]
IKMFYIPKEVGGRYSIFTPVGLLTAAVCGCDINAMLKGARDMNEICNNKDYMQNPAFMYGVLQFISMRKGKNICVMMPYTDSLKYVTDWFSQLWAESLGKKYDVNGNVVFTGQTPVRALGSVDQHSQQQLYMEGPFDKVVTFIKAEKQRFKMPIPTIFEDNENISFLCGSSLNKLINSELESIMFALTENGRPNLVITLPELNEYYIGQLYMMLEIATAFTGYMLNINPFDQPGVEHGKISTYALMGKDGFEERKESIENYQKSKRYKV